MGYRRSSWDNDFSILFLAHWEFALNDLVDDVVHIL